MRENEAKVAGHSDYIFTTQYDLKAREVATILVSSLQERRDTIGPVLDLKLPKRDIVDYIFVLKICRTFRKLK